MFHLYRRPELTDEVHWNAADEDARTVRFSKLKARSDRRMRDLLVLGRDLGRYGLGTARSLSDFAAFCGIDYPGLRLERHGIVPRGDALPTGGRLHGGPSP